MEKLVQMDSVNEYYAITLLRQYRPTFVDDIYAVDIFAMHAYGFVIYITVMASVSSSSSAAAAAAEVVAT